MKLIVSHISRNSLRNKLDLLIGQIKGNIDILMISETKLDESFPISQFQIDRYDSIFRLDCNGNCCGYSGISG